MSPPSKSHVTLLKRATSFQLSCVSELPPPAVWRGLVGCSFIRPGAPYRGTLPIRDSAPLGPYSRNIPRAIWWSQGGGCFLSARYPCSPKPPNLKNLVAGGCTHGDRVGLHRSLLMIPHILSVLPHGGVQGFPWPQGLCCYVTKFTPHKALQSIA